MTAPPTVSESNPTTQTRGTPGCPAGRGPPRRAGVNKPIGPHTLRHAFITAALDAGVPLRDVQEAASHADPRTTMRNDRARTSLDRQRHLHRRRLRRRSRPLSLRVAHTDPPGQIRPGAPVTTKARAREPPFGAAARWLIISSWA